MGFYVKSQQIYAFHHNVYLNWVENNIKEETPEEYLLR